MSEAGRNDELIVKTASAQGLVIVIWKSNFPIDVYCAPEYFVRSLKRYVPTNKLVSSTKSVVMVRTYGAVLVMLT